MSAIYPIPRHTREQTLVADEGQTTFGPLEFVLFDEADVEVFTRPPSSDVFDVPDEEFSVVPVSSLPGFFSIAFAEGLAAGVEVLVRGRRVHEREANVTQGGVIRSTPLEAELDRQSVVLQELRRDVGRAAEAAPGANLVSSTEIYFIRRLTQTQYNALASPSNDTLYIIIGD